MKSRVKGRYFLRQWVRGLRARVKLARRRDLVVLAVTGSVGKTTASHCLHRIISAHHSCHGGIDFNDENSIIRSFLKVAPANSHYVQEVSGHLPGQLQRVLPLIRHRIGIVTSVGLDHYKTYRSRERVAEEKINMIRLLPADGVAVLNADDDLVAAMADESPCRVIAYGQSERADLRATEVEADWPRRLSMTLNWKGESARLETRLFSDLLLSSILAAVAGGLAAGLTLKQCVAPLQGLDAMYGRTSIHSTRHRQWFINDAFKNSYWAWRPVVDRVRRAKAVRKTLVIGSFSDVPGSDSQKYRQIAKQALEVCDRVVLCGSKAKYIPKMMKPEYEGRLFAIEDIEEASRFLYEDVVENELIYLKSVGIEHLERLLMVDEKEVACWKRHCPLLIYCRDCEHSGWLADSV